jgi:L-rhamnose-H+ transport protein
MARNFAEFFRRICGSARAPVPVLANYLFCALAGTTWYFQFFFYSMGETRMGKYKFSSWTLHMASVIIFSSPWGIGLKEWKGAGDQAADCWRWLYCRLWDPTRSSAT